MTLSDARWPMLAGVASAAAALVVCLSNQQIALIFGTPLVALLLIRYAFPRDGLLTPSRAFLPLLLVYYAIALALADLPSTFTHLVALGSFAACFLAGDYAIRALPRPTARPRSDSLAVGTVPLAVAELIGLTIYAWSFRNGVPLLSGDRVSELRVALASSAALVTIGTCLLHATLVADLLLIGRRATLRGGHRASRLHVLVVSLALMGTGVRTNVLLPFVIAGVFLVMHHWRRILRTVVLALGAFGFFIAVGTIRGAGNQLGLFGPAYSYARGSAITFERIIVDTQSGILAGIHGFTWPFHRIILGDQNVLPPGLEVATRLGLEFEGFGLATGVLGAFWLELGTIGPAVGGLALGALAALAFRAWRSRGGWWGVLYAYVVTALIAVTVQHPASNYYSYLMPSLLIAIAVASREQPDHKVPEVHAAPPGSDSLRRSAVVA